MTMAVFTYNFCLLISYPIRFNMLRLSLFQLIFDRETITNIENFLVTGSTVALSCIISIYIPDIRVANVFMGGILAVLISYVIPVL